MWEQLRPADIDRAKQRLAARRIETLTRHAEELKQLDVDQTEIATFERLVVAFTEKHLNQSPLAAPAVTAPEESAAVESSEPPTPAMPQEQILPPRLQVQHQTSANFGMPFRKALRG